MPFPLIKLASLFVKQISKPLGNAVKKSAKSSPTFQNICVKPAECKLYLIRAEIENDFIDFKQSRNKRLYIRP